MIGIRHVYSLVKHCWFNCLEHVYIVGACVNEMYFDIVYTTSPRRILWIVYCSYEHGCKLNIHENIEFMSLKNVDENVGYKSII